MNTTSPPAIRSTALAACLIAFLAGATACGAEGGASSPARQGQQAAQISHAGQLPSVDLIEKAKANQTQYLRQLKAEHANATRPTPGFGDDRRQAIEQAQTARATPGEHAPGYDGALLGER